MYLFVGSSSQQDVKTLLTDLGQVASNSGLFPRKIHRTRPFWEMLMESTSEKLFTFPMNSLGLVYSGFSVRTLQTISAKVKVFALSVYGYGPLPSPLNFALPQLNISLNEPRTSILREQSISYCHQMCQGS